MNRFLLAAALLLSLPVASAQEVYRFVDQDGTVHYTDRPPMSVPAERVGLTYQRTNPAAMESQTESPAGDPPPAEDPEVQETVPAEPPPLTREQKQERCQTARDRALRYATAHRLYREGEDGQREYLSDQELDAERQKAEAAAQEACSD